MKVYITKYVLTKGIIIEEEGNISNFVDGLLIYGSGFCVFKPHWHESKEVAIAQAEDMRMKKLVSLDKQINKLENMSFE